MIGRLGAWGNVESMAYDDFGWIHAPKELAAAGTGMKVVDAWPYGELHALEALWRRVGLPELIAECVDARKFEFSVERALFALVANRVCALSLKSHCQARRQVRRAFQRPHAHRRGPGAGLQAVVPRRAVLAATEERASVAPGAPPGGAAHPRPLRAGRTDHWQHKSGDSHRGVPWHDLKAVEFTALEWVE